MRFFAKAIGGAIAFGAIGVAELIGQSKSGPQLRIETQSVLVDVIVTDASGRPVRGINSDRFTVSEDGRPQKIEFFEEHGHESIKKAPPPILPANVFSNLTDAPTLPVYNVLLLDGLNATTESQNYIHSQALRFLKRAKSGTQIAIFTMGVSLRFIQGFTSDPAVLAAALQNGKNGESRVSPLMTTEQERHAKDTLTGLMAGPTGASPAMIASLQNFLNENEQSQATDRMDLTLTDLQRIGDFLSSFPGRKNVIWFTESVPRLYMSGANMAYQGAPQLAERIKKTLSCLAAARVALYPVDARGLSNNSLYTASNNLSHDVTDASQLLGAPSVGGAPGAPNSGTGGFSNSLARENAERDSEQENMRVLAEQSGGMAFVNTNGLSDVISSIVGDSGDFYTLAYTPKRGPDGKYRSIEVGVTDGKYNLSYRRGYFALDQGLPGGAIETREQALKALRQKNGGAVDPLLPFMDLGMPMSDQIPYEVKVTPFAPNPAAQDKKALHYGIDFAVDLKDLDLKAAPDGMHRGVLNIALLIYDRYGKIINHQEHLAALALKPDVYAAMQKTGVQLHADIVTPKGNYWLRTGIYDENSHKVGTLEIPLAAVKHVEVSSQAAQKTQP